jgi:hypothetical protein
MLFITRSERAQEIARRLESALAEKVEVASGMRNALNLLGRQEFTVVIVDESFVDPDGALHDLLLRLGPAMPVFVNLSLHRTERILSAVVGARRRAVQEQLAAYNLAKMQLEGQLRSSVTAILLTTQHLLTTNLPEATEKKVRSVFNVANGMKMRLSPSPEAENPL